MKKMVNVIFWTIVSLFALATAVFFIALAVLYSRPLKLPEGFTVTAHSGCEHTEDNSIEYLKKGLEVGADVLEIDVTFRRDGTPVVIHKDVAEDGEGLLFDEAIKFISEQSDSVKLNLDLKSTANLKAISEITDKYGITDRCFFTGVKEDFVEAVKRDGGPIPYYLNVSLPKDKKKDADELKKTLDKVKESGAIGINCKYVNASREMVELFHENGMLVSYWTPKTKPIMRWLIYIEADNITTRHPITLKSMLD